MYSDLFDHLGSNAGGGSGGNSSSSNEKQLVSFKAGKMDLTLQENGNYWAAPDTRRGEIRLVWKTSDTSLYWEWYDRREKSVADADRQLLYSAGGTANDLGTLQRVQDVPNAAPQDRLYVWSRPEAGSDNPNYHMYWLQDASEEKDDELIAQVNQYLSDPASANPSSGSSSSGTAAGSSSGNAAEGGASGSSSSSDRQQVDALSNILENLGMPQNESGSSGAAASSTAARSGTTGTLTLADLQGAMAGIQPQGSPGPPLQELVTPASISALLEDEDVKKRLLELLPEDQRSEEFLEENLRSPQVQQTLRSLTAALLPDDTGSMDGYHSVLANFQMAEGAQEALQNNSNNPVQAFLDCVLKSVEKEEEEKEEGKEEESKEEESKE